MTIQIALVLGAAAIVVALLLRRRQDAPSPALPAPGSPPVPPEVVAAITAALAVVLEQPHRILDIRRSREWALEGRRQHLASHVLHRK